MLHLLHKTYMKHELAHKSNKIQFNKLYNIMINDMHA